MDLVFYTTVEGTKSFNPACTYSRADSFVYHGINFLRIIEINLSKVAYSVCVFVLGANHIEVGG